MGTFLHACHLARIDRGELERTTGIIEHYLNQEGRIEVTPQNARLHTYGNLRITSAQRIAATRADRRTFWRLRKAAGDPIADVALPILENRGMNGRMANFLTGLSDNPERLHELGVALMKAHINATIYDYDNCIGNVPGLLSPEQVAAYHHAVFNQFGIGPQFWNNSSGSWLFGGTLLNLPANLYRPVWCHACDFTGTGIGRPEGF